MTATVTSGAHSGRAIVPALAAPIACGCCLLAGATYVAANDPTSGGVFLPCPFRVLTGWWCPGCGLTRATHHLLHGDIGQALRYNLFVVVVLAALAGAWAAWLLRCLGRSLPSARGLASPASIVALVVMLVFAVVRNVAPLPLTG